MHRVRCAFMNQLLRNFHNNVQYSRGTEAAVKESTPLGRDIDDRQWDGMDDINETFHKTRLPRRSPLVKNFFAGVADRELLAYPESIPREALVKMHQEIFMLKDYFANIANRPPGSEMLDATMLKELRSLEVYGSNVPQRYGGKGWQCSHSLLAAEEESKCPSVAVHLLSHRTVIDAVHEHGSEEQKRKFLPKLASGEMVATEAIYEYNEPRFHIFDTIADYNADDDSWQLNGQKAFVATGPHLDDTSLLYLVIAQTYRPNVLGDGGRGTTLFLVDSNSDGIGIGDEHMFTGCRSSRFSKVTFRDVQVPASCVLGHAHKGHVVAEGLLRSGRLRNSVIGLGMAKRILGDMWHYLLTNGHNSNALNMEINQLHLSDATCTIYAMESMIYFTAGLLDEFESPDVVVEAAITKYFTLEQLLKMSMGFQDVVGPRSLIIGEPSEVAIRDATHLYAMGERMDTLRLLIAMSGLQHVGMETQENIRKERNPLLHPMFVLGQIFSTPNFENPKTNMRLHEHLHPSLELNALSIEQSIVRLQMCTNLLLRRYGNDVVHRHGDIQRLTEMATWIYAMFTSSARASRSYCIGLQFAEHEMYTAATICMRARDLVKAQATDILHGRYVNGDVDLQRLAKQISASRGYYATHPLTYNY